MKKVNLIIQVIAILIITSCTTVESGIVKLNAEQSKNYTIPTIDLSDEVDRHVVIDRDSSRYFGHPSTILMDDGKTIYCAYSISHGGAPLFLKKSLDGGLTWSDYLPVPANAEQLGNCPFLFNLEDSAGNERLLMMVGGDDGVENGMWQASSYDGGQTWSDYINNGCTSIVASPTMYAVDEGKKLLIWHHASSEGGRVIETGSQKGRGALDILQSESIDGGKTWGNTHVVCEIEDAAVCEPAVVLSPDKKVMACLIRENTRRLNSVVIFSEDEGQNWSKAVELPASLTGDRHEPKYTEDKKYLLVVFRDMAEQSSTYGSFVLWVGTFDDIVNGREGLCRVKLLHQYGEKNWDTGYGGLERLPDGTFIATTYVRYKEEDKHNSIVSVRFTMNDILERLP